MSVEYLNKRSYGKTSSGKMLALICAVLYIHIGNGFDPTYALEQNANAILNNLESEGVLNKQAL